MIPEVPSGLNFAEGFVINSIRSMLSAGICSRIWAWLSADKPDALPLIQIVTLEFPRKEISPSLSTSTEGIFSSSSLADPPAWEILDSTSKTFLSISNLI